MAQMMWWMVQPVIMLGFTGSNDVVYGTAIYIYIKLGLSHTNYVERTASNQAGPQSHQLCGAYSQQSSWASVTLMQFMSQ